MKTNERKVPRRRLSLQNPAMMSRYNSLTKIKHIAGRFIK